MPLLLAFAGFVLLGVISASAGVLLPAQMGDYGVDRATIGITFFMVSAGFVIAGLGSGALISRLGLRMTLITGGAAYALSGLCLALRPPFAVFVAVQVLAGYGTGILETVLQAYIAPRPGATTLLNRLHAFWGVGALAGPLLASWLGFTSWRAVLLVLALASVPLTAAFALFPKDLPSHAAERPVVPPPAPAPAPASRPGPSWARHCGTGASWPGRSCWPSTSGSRSAWAAGPTATWCRDGAWAGPSRGMRSPGTGWG
jgi:MFS family permease